MLLFYPLVVGFRRHLFAQYKKEISEHQFHRLLRWVHNIRRNVWVRKKISGFEIFTFREPPSVPRQRLHENALQSLVFFSP